MELTGIVIANLGITSGQGRNGTWRKLEFVIEVGTTYPKRVCISVLGDKVDTINPRVGDNVTCHIEIESREYNSRWYTEVKAWKVTGNQSVTEKYEAKRDESVGTNVGTGIVPEEDGTLPF